MTRDINTIKADIIESSRISAELCGELLAAEASLEESSRFVPGGQEDLTHRQKERLHWMAMMLCGVQDSLSRLECKDREHANNLMGCESDIAAVVESIRRLAG